jgi:ubiquinone/menaquinone biosynthesis C-methylase UbiE
MRTLFSYRFQPYCLPLLAILLLPTGCSGEPPADTSSAEYSYTESNRDGIGKFYMDREIAHVMGHQGARWLDRPERTAEERTDLLLENLPISPGDKVADIGAGTGFFSLKMARLVGTEGVVYAVDIQPEMLDIVKDRSEEQKLKNVRRVLATADNPRLPENELSMALFVDAYHEFEWPREVMSRLYTSLKPGGKIVLIEYRAEDPSVPILRLHKMTEMQARLEMEAVGFAFVENREILPQQHFLLFEKPAAGTD